MADDVDDALSKLLYVANIIEEENDDKKVVPTTEVFLTSECNYRINHMAYLLRCLGNKSFSAADAHFMMNKPYSAYYALTRWLRIYNAAVRSYGDDQIKTYSLYTLNLKQATMKSPCFQFIEMKE
jgi:hypothetical protein